MRKTKTQKGITLVALIITIIVLLILAIVAIGAVQDDGIIQYAKNARSEYEAAQVKENTALSNYLDKLNENNPTNPDDTTEKPTAITITGDTTEVHIKDSITLGLTADKGTVSATDVIWTSSNNTIAEVNENGEVLGKKLETTQTEGATVTITATLKNHNSIVATKEITVKPVECTACTKGYIATETGEIPTCNGCDHGTKEIRTTSIHVSRCPVCDEIVEFGEMQYEIHQDCEGGRICTH